MNTDDLTLIIGNKNLSSWSMRPYVAMRQAEVPFREQVIWLDRPETRATIGQNSPSGLVPALKVGSLTIWDSLAIMEWVNERYPEKNLWPEAPEARAIARSASAEMHSGFADLRGSMPMNIMGRMQGQVPGPGAKRDIDRIMTIWNHCRERYGAGGPFLFGRFSIADAMYAPVVSRFYTYGVAPGGAPQAYMEAVWECAGVRSWREGAAREVADA